MVSNSLLMLFKKLRNVSLVRIAWCRFQLSLRVRLLERVIDVVFKDIFSLNLSFCKGPHVLIDCNLPLKVIHHVVTFIRRWSVIGLHIFCKQVYSRWTFLFHAWIICIDVWDFFRHQLRWKKVVLDHFRQVDLTPQRSLCLFRKNLWCKHLPLYISTDVRKVMARLLP